ncbi:MAG: redox-sensing transcriptional repressor Rex [Chloroflexi bacterium]|nr:redox-sensing transcriptional repressor Rex [Chloroflexota bacterium]
MSDRPSIPQPSLRRLPLYYRLVSLNHDKKLAYTSSRDLGLTANVPAARVRKDLSYLGERGRPGVGYDTELLMQRLETFLGLINDKEAVLVGVGNLGRALALYPGFARYGLKIAGLFDIDPAKIGQMVGTLKIMDQSRLPDLVRRWRIQMGIIAVPAQAAQGVAEKLIRSGISVIWNFAPVTLVVPPYVLVKDEDLAVDLATLSHQIVERDQAR